MALRAELSPPPRETRLAGLQTAETALAARTGFAWLGSAPPRRNILHPHLGYWLCISLLAGHQPPAVPFPRPHLCFEVCSGLGGSAPAAAFT